MWKWLCVVVMSLFLWLGEGSQRGWGWGVGVIKYIPRNVHTAPCFSIKAVFPGKEISIIKIRRSRDRVRRFPLWIWDRLIFIMGKAASLYLYWNSHQVSSLVCLSVWHCNDVIMSAMASQITSLIIVYSSVYSGIDQRKHQSSASPVFLMGIHRWLVNSPHKGPITRKMFPFDGFIKRSNGLNIKH